MFDTRPGLDDYWWLDPTPDGCCWLFTIKNNVLMARHESEKPFLDVSIPFDLHDPNCMTLFDKFIYRLLYGSGDIQYKPA